MATKLPPMPTPGLAEGESVFNYLDTAATKGKPMGWQAESDWQKTLEVMRSVGMVKPDIKPADVFSNAFIASTYVRAN